MKKTNVATNLLGRRVTVDPQWSPGYRHLAGRTFECVVVAKDSEDAVYMVLRDEEDGSMETVYVSRGVRVEEAS
jgi:hypothetical protein